MAEIVLGQIGSVIGAALLPNGASAFGLTASGAAIGGVLGGTAGRFIDSALRPPLEGPRLPNLQIMESREGASIPIVYGRMRVPGQLIWAARFLEKRREQSAGKGGPRYTEYSYCLSFAVAICAGPITRMDRIWANGSELQLSQTNYRLYHGDEAQLPDPLIEAIEGAGMAPAYRGVSYIVFEDLPLDDFGNRLPQLSFEIVRSSTADRQSLGHLIQGVNIIPASGEFVYATSPVHERRFPGINKTVNVNNGQGVADFSVSLEQLQSDLPRVARAALTVAWFGNDIRAGICRLRPGVEAHERQTTPFNWSVGGLDRAAAYRISRTDDSPNFGGTPADRAVIEGIQALHNVGIAVTLSPFILMDIPDGNDLPDPSGTGYQPPFPWRGRISVHSDNSATVRDEITAFVGEDGGFGFRHFILHHARLAAEAGGVEAFLIGSEMVGLTRLRDETGAFPFVDALIALADEVRAILGDNVKVSYAADWTEYGAYVPNDGSGDVMFPLDALWASPNIDFVGVDWYPPLGDWRDGDDHLDAKAGFLSAEDLAYLAANLQGGEAYDWYYASAQDRADQNRTVISDTAYGEDWIFRQKDLLGWWRHNHQPRIRGVRTAEPTLWQAQMKPIRLIEIGYPAVDRGGNAPNLFYDPKSSESALPPFSRGYQDDLYQRNALAIAVRFWQAQSGVDAVLVWAWDGRPWPYYPALETVWSDGPNWQFGHWLNGRTGQTLLSELISDMGRQAGLNFQANALLSYVEGFVVSGPISLRQALTPLQTVFQFELCERASAFLVSPEMQTVTGKIQDGAWIEARYSEQHRLLDKAPGRLRLTYISGQAAYAPTVIDAYNDNGDPNETLDLNVPLVLSDAYAETLARRLMSQLQASHMLELSLGPEHGVLDPGALLTVRDRNWKIERIEHQGLVQHLLLRAPPTPAARLRAVSPDRQVKPAIVPGVPEFVWIDASHRRRNAPVGPLAAIAQDPWGGTVRIRAGGDTVSLTERGAATSPAGVGQLLAPLERGPLGRWDRANSLQVYMPSASLASRSPGQVLNGDNRILVQSYSDWEMLAFETATLVGEDLWQLSGLLRGILGSPVQSAPLGARVVLYDSRLVSLDIDISEIGLQRLWQAGRGAPFEAEFENRADLPTRIGHLRAERILSGWCLNWTRRDKELAESWALPEAENIGRFVVELWRGAELVETITDAAPPIRIDDLTLDRVQVAQFGPDNRRGPWVSIQLQTPYMPESK